MPDQKENLEQAKGARVPRGDESLEITVNKSKKEVSLKDPATGRLVTLKANVIEDEEEKFTPLASDEFRKALERLSSLGLTWTADRIPRVIAKTPDAESALFGEEFQTLQAAYPNLPRELSAVVYHALTGSQAYPAVVGTDKELREKVSTVRDLLLTPSYRAEFFFKYSIKVPYFETIDWEVVFKTRERNVSGMPAVAYALLLLTFHNPNARLSKINEHQDVTVAVDMKLVDRLIGLLLDVKAGLEDAQKLSDVLYEHSTVEADNGTNR